MCTTTTPVRPSVSDNARRSRQTSRCGRLCKSDGPVPATPGEEIGGVGGASAFDGGRLLPRSAQGHGRPSSVALFRAYVTRIVSSRTNSLPRTGTTRSSIPPLAQWYKWPSLSPRCFLLPGWHPGPSTKNVEVPIVMDMSLSTLVVLGLVLLAVLLVVGYVALRVGFGRAQATGNLPSQARSQRDDTKRAKLH